ncbi:unnamed protein product [Alopecurus aequalis]
MAAAAVGEAIAVVAPMPPQPEEKEVEQPPMAAAAVFAPMPPQPEVEQPPVAADAAVAPMPPQPQKKEVDQPPMAADAVVVQMPPQPEVEQPPMSAYAVVAPVPPQPQVEEDEQPPVAADAVGEAIAFVTPIPPPMPPPPQQQQDEEAEDEQPMPAAALPQPLESGPGPVEEGYKETPQDENPLQVPSPADEADEDTSQDNNPLKVPGPADEEDKDTSQDKNSLQVPGPADEGDKVTLQGQNHVNDCHDSCDCNRSRSRYRRGYDCLPNGRLWDEQRYHECYDEHGGRYPGDPRDHWGYVEAHARRIRREQGGFRYNDHPFHGLRYRGGHIDHRDCVDPFHGDRCCGDHKDHREYDDPCHGRRYPGDHNDRENDYFLNQCEQRDHRDYSLPYGMNGFYNDDPLRYGRCGCMKCRFGARGMFSDYSHQYNPMDSLDDKRVYAHTPCCLRNLVCATTDYPVGAALINPGKWTCFLNCILQCVVHTVPLVSKLLKDGHLGLCPSGSDEFCCYCSLRHHAAEAIRLSGNVLYPKKFVKLLKLISQDFRWGGHQDAHELLRCLLDKLDDVSVAPRLSSEEPSSIVKEVFGGQLKSQLHCPECNHCSDRLESFLDLSLEINQMDTVLDSLESFTKIEVVESFICDGCKSRVNMEKHLKVEQAPEVLVIQLKRFENSGSSTSKIQEMVKYHLELDLKPFMSSTDTNPQNYDLYGVVEHLGNSSKGHYVCYIRSSQTDWYLFNDDKVLKLSEESVLDSKAYLLFYVKQGSSPWFSTLLEEKNILLSGYLQELADKGLNEDGVSIDSDKGSYTGSSGDSDEQDSEEYLFGGPAARNDAGPSSVSLSQKTQGNANGSMNIPDKNEVSCCSSLGGGQSGETQKPTSPPRSSAENGNVCGLTLPLEYKENLSPQGSDDDKEMSHSTHGASSQVNGSSHKHEEDSCPENLALHKDDEMIGDDDEMRGSCDSPAGGLRTRRRIGTSGLRTIMGSRPEQGSG